MTELKPCPFCGGRARLFRIGHQSGTAFDDWGIECVQCGAMPWAFSMFTCRTQDAGGSTRNLRRAVEPESRRRDGMNKMVCPCCGGSIELENDAEGACDTCMTYISAGELVPDPEYCEESDTG